MSLVNYSSIIASPRDGISVRGKQRGSGGAGKAPTTRTKQASKTFYSSGRPSFTVTAVKSYLKGARSNQVNVGIFRQSGSRYIITCYEDDSDKMDGTLSTAALGDEKVTSAGIVTKINSSAMAAYVTATLHTSYSNIDYTGNSGVTAADAQATGSLGGGRG